MNRPLRAPLDEKAALGALGALAQPQRLRVFRALVGAGPAGTTPGVLSALLGLPGSTLSFHLRELAQAGMVTHERDGRRLIYRPAIDRMTDLLAYLTAHCCHGTPCGLDPGGASTGCSPAQAGPSTKTLPSLHETLPMTDPVYNVLFICTHNSARSILAEGILAAMSRGRFNAFSAGSHPAGAVHPLALETLATLSLPTGGYRSKDWNEFAQAGAPVLDFVFTVCDTAAGEVCPVWPGQPLTAHWGVADPAAFEGSDNEKRRVFRDTAIVLKRRIELMLALPLASLDRMAILREVREIGSR